MPTKDFDLKFQELTRMMVEISFEYVNNNTEEVDEIYIYLDTEGGHFFNVFYKINGHIVKKHQANFYSKMQYDISREMQMRLIKSGSEYLQFLTEAFRDDGRPIPSNLRLIYNAKLGSFNSSISYNKHHDPGIFKGDVEFFNEWFVEMGGVNG